KGRTIFHIVDFRVTAGRRTALLLVAISTLLPACSDDTLKVRDVQGCYELSGIQGTSETVPPPATLDEAAGVSVVSARYILTPDRMYTSSYVVSYGEGGIKTSASVFAVGSFRLHKDQVITVDGKGNESTLTFDKALQRLTAS